MSLLIFTLLALLDQVTYGSGVCLNNATCDDNVQPPVCLCADGYKGSFCNEAFSCLPPFEAYQDRCFLLLTTNTSSFTSAHSDCQRNGGSLARVRSYRHLTTTTSYLKRNATNQVVWIGQVDAVVGESLLSMVALEDVDVQSGNITGCYEMSPSDFNVTRSLSCSLQRLALCEWRPAARASVPTCPNQAVNFTSLPNECYTFNATNVTFDTARRQCQQEGGELVTNPYHIEVNSWIRATAISTNASVWLGTWRMFGTNQGVVNLYGERKSFPYSAPPWLSTINQTVGEYCVIYNEGILAFDQAACNSTVGFVCRFTVDPNAVLCPASFQAHCGRCLAFDTEPTASQMEAEQRCSQMGGAMAAADGTSLLQSVDAFVVLNNPSLDSWTANGGLCNLTSCSLQTLQQAQFAGMKLALCEAVPLLSAAGNMPATCNVTSYLSPSSATSSHPVCPTPYYLHTGHCYYVPDSTARTTTDSSVYCVGWAGYVAIADTTEKQYSLRSFLGGLATADSFFVANSSDPSSCFEMQGPAFTSVIVANCSYLKRTICELLPYEENRVQACPPGSMNFSSLPGTCFHYSSSMMAFNAARDYCKSFGGDLAEDIADESVFNWAISLVSIMPRLWVGIFDMEDKNSKLFSGGRASMFTPPWAASRPNSEAERCNVVDGIMVPPGYLNDIPCELSSSIYALCELKLNYSVTANTCDLPPRIFNACNRVVVTALQNESAEYTCASSTFFPDGSTSKTALCRYGAWEQVPTEHCVPGCATPASVHNATHNVSAAWSASDTTVLYTCSVNMAFLDGLESKTAVCSSGTWVGMPTDGCYPECFVPVAVANATCNVSSTKSPHNTTAAYTCRTNFTFVDLSTQKSMRCSDGNWEYPPNDGCYPACGPAPSVTGVTQNVTATLSILHTVVGYSCSGVTRFSDATTAKYSTCQDGLWQPTPPLACLTGCNAPPSLGNSTKNVSATWSPPNTVVTYNCTPGWSFLDGLDVKSPVCSSGTWVGMPTDGCFPACATPLTVHNATHNVSAAWSPPSTIGVYTCSVDMAFLDGLEIKSSVCSSGTWIGMPTDGCYPECFVPVAVANATCNVSSSKSPHNTPAVYSCRTNYTFLDLSTQKSMRCNNGNWEYPPNDGCYPACGPAATVSGATQNVTANLSIVDTVVRYSCNGTTRFSDATTAKYSACEDGLWQPTPPLACLPGCSAPPSLSNSTKNVSAGWSPPATVVTYNCTSGWSFLDGLDVKSPVCSGGTWVGMPTDGCYPMCGSLPAVVGAVANVTALWSPSGTVAEYECIADLRFPNGGVEHATFCLDGQWQQQPTEDCVAGCDVPPLLRNTGMNVTGAWYPTDTVGVIDCVNGYLFANGTDATVITCSNRTWIGLPVDGCDGAIPGANLVAGSNLTTAGSAAVYTCDAGLQFHNGETAAPSVCRNGSWVFTVQPWYTPCAPSIASVGLGGAGPEVNVSCQCPLHFYGSSCEYFCPPPYVGVCGKCLFRLNTTEQFERGRSTCQLFGGDLVRIANESDLLAAATYLRLTASQPAYVGVVNGNESVEVAVSDEIDTCSFLAPPSFALPNATVCEEKMDALCEFRRYKQLEVTETCPPDSVHLAGHSGTCFSLGRLPLRYDAARRVCQELGGDLTTDADAMLDMWSALQSESMQLFQGELSDSNFVWIGAVDIDRNGELFWLHGKGSVVRTSPPWRENRPNKEQEKCIAVDSMDHASWNDKRCDQEGWFVCQIFKASSVNTQSPSPPLPSPPPSPAGDVCAQNACLHNGTCIPMPSAFTCQCQLPALGAICEYIADGLCDSEACQHGATCFLVDGTSHCACQAGFLGDACEINIDECLSSPCVHGTCVDSANAFLCLCQAGYIGRLCEKPKNECLSTPCRQGAMCIDQLDGYQCICPSGFAGMSCQINIDDCRSRPCQNNGFCNDMVNSFQCECTTSFKGMYCQDETSTSKQHKMLVQSFAYIAITGICFVFMMMILLDLSKWACRKEYKLMQKIKDTFRKKGRDTAKAGPRKKQQKKRHQIPQQASPSQQHAPVLRVTPPAVTIPGVIP